MKGFKKTPQELLSAIIVLLKKERSLMESQPLDLKAVEENLKCIEEQFQLLLCTRVPDNIYRDGNDTSHGIAGLGPGERELTPGFEEIVLLRQENMEILRAIAKSFEGKFTIVKKSKEALLAYSGNVLLPFNEGRNQHTVYKE